MSIIAVAGGAGGIGKTLVQALAKTDHQVIIFSRSDRESDQPNVTYAKVDYTDTKSLTKTLEDRKIDTVISAIAMDGAASYTAQLNLISAASKSTVTKRFIPSEYGGKVDAEIAKVDPFAKYWIEAAEALSKTSLQWTRLSIGFIMDYWGMPHIDSAMAPFKWAIDVENGVAAIPGTGNELMTMTYSRDLAKFVVRLLEEEEWPERSVIVGQDVTFNQLLKWAQETTGRKFKVSYDGEEKLEKGEVTELYEGMAGSPNEELAVAFGSMNVKGWIHVGEEDDVVLNKKFPEVKTLTVEEMIRQNWSE